MGCGVHRENVVRIVLILFFLYTLPRFVGERTHNAQQGGHETRGTGVGRTKQWVTETLGDLWKGEGWDGEHGEYKMDITGTFRTLHDRKLSGRKADKKKFRKDNGR